MLTIVAHPVDLLYYSDTQWRSPEEYRDGPLTEKIDVWSLGCNMMTILTGLNPHYTIHNYNKYRVSMEKARETLVLETCTDLLFSFLLYTFF